MTWCQKRRICLQTDLIISERWVPGFITVTKCLLFNHIICQLSARLRQANLTSTCTGDHTELPPGCCFTNIWFQDVSGVSMRGWALQGGTVHTPFLLLFCRTSPTLCLPVRWSIPRWVPTGHWQTHTAARSFWSLSRCMVLCGIPLLPEDEIQRSLFFLAIHSLLGLTPTEGRQTSFSQNNSSQNGERKNLLKEFLKHFPFWWL